MDKGFDKIYKNAEMLENRVYQNKTPALVEMRLEEAYKMYNKAAYASQNVDEIRKSVEKLTKVLLLQMNFFSDHPERCANYDITMSDSISKLSYWLSYEHYVFRKPNEVCGDLIDDLVGELFLKLLFCTENVLDSTLLQIFAEGSHERAYCYRAHLHYKAAEALFKQSIVLSRDDNHRAAKLRLEDAYKPVEDCRKTCREAFNQELKREEKQFVDEVFENIQIVSREVEDEKIRTEAFVLLTNAEKMHEKIMTIDEDLNFGEVYVVFDMYQLARVKVDEKDVELEAKIYSRMGIYHYKVLKLPASKEKAKDYLTKSIRLALSLEPKNVTQEQWYREAATLLETLQQEFLKTEESKLEEEKKKYEKELGELKTFLNNLGPGYCGIDTLRQTFSSITAKYGPPSKPDFKFIQKLNKKVSYS